MTEVPRSTDKLISPGRSIGVLGASGWAAVSALAVSVVASRVLDTADYTQFLVYWSVLFGCFQVLSGLQNEAARSVSVVTIQGVERAGRLRSHAAAVFGVDGSNGAAGKHLPRVILMTVVLAGAVAALAAAISPWWAHRLDVGVLLLIVSVVMIVSYGCQLTLVGMLAGRREWGTMAALSATEATFRMALVLVVAFTLHSLTSMRMAAAIPALTWVVFALFVPRAHKALSVRADVGLKHLLANGAWAMLAAASAAVLVNGFPAVASAALGAATPGLASILIGVQLTRAPILMPLGAFQGVAIAGFVSAKQGRTKALLKPMAAILGIGLVLALAVGLVGPWVMRLLYPSQYALTNLALGGLAFAAVSIALLTLTGAATIAIGAHRLFVAGWVVGAAAAVALLFGLPLVGVGRVIASVLIGPVFGMTVHLVAVRNHDRATLGVPGTSSVTQ